MIQKPLRPTPISLQTANQRAFSSLYDTYAPRLWGCILLANLPIPQAEAILTHTLASAWHQLEKPAFGEKYQLSQLLHLAYQQGLPSEALRTIFLSEHRESVRKATSGPPR